MPLRRRRQTNPGVRQMHFVVFRHFSRQSVSPYASKCVVALVKLMHSCSIQWYNLLYH